MTDSYQWFNTHCLSWTCRRCGRRFVMKEPWPPEQKRLRRCLPCMYATVPDFGNEFVPDPGAWESSGF